MLFATRCPAGHSTGAASFRRGLHSLPLAVLLLTWWSLPAAAQRPSRAGETQRPTPANLLQMTPLNEIPLDPRSLTHPVPPDTSRGLLGQRLGDLRELRMEQGWAPITMHWRATDFWHRPLYFEDVLLERHGQTRGPLVQPFFSALHFFGSVALLPYKMGLEPPRDHIYTLGYGRPGSCKPPLKRRLPLELDASSFQTAAIVGLILLVP